MRPNEANRSEDGQWQHAAVNGVRWGFDQQTRLLRLVEPKAPTKRSSVIPFSSAASRLPPVHWVGQRRAAPSRISLLMTLPEFVSLWQARPFRAFRLRTADTTLAVDHPLGAALLPAQMAIAVIEGDTAKVVPLADIAHGGAHGPPLDPAAAVAAIDPVRLAHEAALLAAIQRTTEPPAPATPPVRDPGRVEYRTIRAADGSQVVHATVFTREDRMAFGTEGTNWRAHGHEAFENGTALYLHHAAHPTVEQRILLWPPDRGTFDSFAEARPLDALRRELVHRDSRLVRKPAKPASPPPAWYRSIVPAYPRIRDDERLLAFGRDDDDFDRYETRLTHGVAGSGHPVTQPSLIDVAAESILFHVAGTAWSGDVERRDETFVFRLEDTESSGAIVAFTVDPRRLTARLNDDGRPWPLGFFQRALHNFMLHGQWDLLRASLHAGPPGVKRPDHFWPLAGNYRLELWPGDVRHPLPFLQPLILDPQENPLLDLRATAWAAVVQPQPGVPRVRLRLVSHESTERLADGRLTIEIELLARYITCPGYRGSTSLGMLQALLRQVRGTKWLHEELPRWLAKGRDVPRPPN